MALSVQNVIDNVSFELRKVLDGTGGSGADFDLMLRWVDETHKDLMHTGIYQHALRTSTTITSAAGTRSYSITPTNIRRIDGVYDRTSESFLSPYVTVLAPASLADPVDRGSVARPDKYIASFRTSSAFPQYFRLSTVVTSGTPAHTIHLYPAPEAAEHAGTVDIFYLKQAVTVSAAGTALDAGEDSRDAMTAGVLARAYRYLHAFEQAAYWTDLYESMKLGETV